MAMRRFEKMTKRQQIWWLVNCMHLATEQMRDGNMPRYWKKRSFYEIACSFGGSQQVILSDFDAVKNLTYEQTAKLLLSDEVRVTPEHIKHLPAKHIFVFGSNLAGEHNGGAAKDALKHGAVYGEPIGRHGYTYAIPTKAVKNLLTDHRASLPLKQIKKFVAEFIRYAKNHPDLTFLVVEIGCGRAGYEPSDIAPMFASATQLPNVHLPETFWRVLKP
jgi:hypothetical protein